MHPEMYAFIHSKPEYKKFIRFNPIWYRNLNKHPDRLDEFIEQSRKYHGQTLPQRMQRWQKNMDLILFMLKMLNKK